MQFELIMLNEYYYICNKTNVSTIFILAYQVNHPSKNITVLSVAEYLNIHI